MRRALFEVSTGLNFLVGIGPNSVSYLNKLRPLSFSTAYISSSYSSTKFPKSERR